MVELKKCPFCGDKAVIGEGSDHAYVTCRNCACATPVCSTVEQAIDIWNTRAVQNGKKDEKEEEEKTIPPYLKLKKSLYDVIQMACALCKTKHCQSGFTECSGIVDAKVALAEPPRNCDVEETYRTAICEYLKTHPEVNQNVSLWGWGNWYAFALWLFKKQKENKNHADNRT